MYAATVTVGATGTYPSIAAAITGIALNGPITEPLSILLTPDYAQLADSIQAIAGASITNTVTISPQAILTVAGNGGFVLKMNGCQYVTVDGRIGGTGLPAITLRADTLTGVSTTTALKKSVALQITNSSNNTIQYVNFKAATNESFWNGQPTAAPTIGTITLAAGSTNITIDHCDIGPLHPYSGTPTVSIVSLGTAIAPNSGIVISNNNIYDYFARDMNKCTTIAGSGVGILIYNYSSNCTISGNSFYQTLPRTAFANNNGAKTAAIAIQNTSGSSFIVKNNYIGGSQTLCGGTPYTNTIGNNTGFNGIYVAAANTGQSAVYGNIIRNIYLVASSPIANVYQSAAIAISGLVNVGVMENGTTAAGNVIGDQSSTAVGTTNASIIFTGSGTTCAFSGILFNSLAGSNVNISNNKIAGISINLNTTAKTASFVGINITGTTASTCLIDHNEIGNNAVGVTDPTLMSIQNYQGGKCYGIYMNTAGDPTSTLTISNNKINNMYKALDTFTPANQTYVNGIWFNANVIAFPVTITNNEIRDLVFSTNRVSDTQYYWSSGITFGGTGAGSVIKNNTIYNIAGQGGYSTSVIGINLLPTSSATTMDVYSNLIYNLSSDRTRKLGQYATGLTGIFVNTYSTAATAMAPTLNIYNNMIRLGYNRAGNELQTISTLVGIRDSMLTTGAAKANYYYNTIYIGGTQVAATDTVPTFGMSFATSAMNATVRNVKNNLIVNARSNASTGSNHYAIGTLSTNALTAFTASNNEYAVSGTGGVLGHFANTDATTLPAVQGYTGDANSLNMIPAFMAATSASPNLHLDQSVSTNSSLAAGITITSITTDYDTDIRTGTPTMGADEYTGRATKITNPTCSTVSAYARDKNLMVIGIVPGDVITVYTLSGQRQVERIATSDLFSASLSTGVYIVHIKTAGGTVNIKTIIN